MYCVDLSASNTVVNARLAYGGVAAVPARAVKTEAFLMGKPWQASTITQGAAVLATEFKPLDDFRASANYRQLLIQTLFKKFYAQYPATPQEVTA